METSAASAEKKTRIFFSSAQGEEELNEWGKQKNSSLFGCYADNLWPTDIWAEIFSGPSAQ